MTASLPNTLPGAINPDAAGIRRKQEDFLFSRSDGLRPHETFVGTT
ncbi:hypothetical protein [Roseibium sp. MMSF_3412]|nr:hypothetical protein [Roseibium sp. MMSF_3412]